VPPLNTITIGGPSYANDGDTIYFNASVSNAEGAVNYQWYYRQETYSSWVADGNNSSGYSHTFSSAPGGETEHSAVKVEITSAGENASDVHSVTVEGCSGTSFQQSTASSNIIIPCN
jgi:hypothetical protein